MNEKQLKEAFCSAVESHHITSNDNACIPAFNHGNKIRIINEAYFRSFDLVIAEIIQKTSPDIDNEGKLAITTGSINARLGLLRKLADSEKCQIDRIRLFPIELKSDDDVIDERLPNQIINAILTFGTSTIVLDKRHAKRVKSDRSYKMIPANIICYTGNKDHFELLSVFNRFVYDGVFHFHKRKLARLMMENNIKYNDRIHNRLETMKRILEKMAFNQIGGPNLGLDGTEIEFIKSIIETRSISTAKQVNKAIKESKNYKITEYFGDDGKHGCST